MQKIIKRQEIKSTVYFIHIIFVFLLKEKELWK